MTPEDRTIDAALVLKAQTADASAFEELVRRHDAPLRYYVRRLLGAGPAAEDITQEAWLAALRQVRNLRDGGAFRVWLCRVARNLCVSYIRRQSGTRPVDLDTVEEPQAPEGDSEEALDWEDAAALQRAILGLSAPHREAVALRFIEGLAYEEIAEVIGCRVGTVRSRLHNAKAELRKALRPPNTK